MSWNRSPEDMGLGESPWANYKPSTSLTAPPTPKNGIPYQNQSQLEMSTIGEDHPHTEDGPPTHSTGRDWADATSGTGTPQPVAKFPPLREAKFPPLSSRQSGPPASSTSARTGAQTTGNCTPVLPKQLPARLRDAINHRSGSTTPAQAARQALGREAPTPTSGGPPLNTSQLANRLEALAATDTSPPAGASSQQPGGYATPYEAPQQETPAHSVPPQPAEVTSARATHSTAPSGQQGPGYASSSETSSYCFIASHEQTPIPRGHWHEGLSMAGSQISNSTNPSAGDHTPTHQPRAGTAPPGPLPSQGQSAAQEEASQDHMGPFRGVHTLSSSHTIPARPDRTPPPPPLGASGSDTPVSHTGYTFNIQVEPTLPATPPTGGEQPMPPMPPRHHGTAGGPHAFDPWGVEDTANQGPAQPQVPPAAGTPNAAPTYSWITTDPAAPANTPMPTAATLGEMQAYNPLFRGRTYPHGGDTANTEHRFYKRERSILHMLDTLGAAGHGSVADVVVTLADGYTNELRNLRPLTKHYHQTAPLYFLVPREVEHLVAQTADPDRRAPHPMTTRIRDECLEQANNHRWAHFTGSMTSNDPADLHTWALYNGGRHTPPNVYAWVLMEGPPTDDNGLHFHNPQTNGTYHPRLARDIGVQPKEGRPLCRHFARRGRCHDNNKCDKLHVPTSGMSCRQYTSGHRCRQMHDHGRCDRIHGSKVSHPTGTETRGDGGRLAITPDTVPDLLTTSAYPPPVTQTELDKAANAFWFPVPSPHTYTRHKDNMDNALYGLPPFPRNWRQPHMDLPVPAVQNGFHTLLESINNPSNLPTESAAWLLENCLVPMIEALPMAAEEYDPGMTEIDRRGRPSPLEERPTRRGPLREELTHITTFLMQRVEHVRAELERERGNLRERP